MTIRATEEKRLRRRVRSWAWGFLGLDERDFDDAYQAAWLRVIEYLRSGRPVRNLEHFLRWEVANSWKMELRRRQRRPSLGFDDCPEEALDKALVAPDAAAEVERLEDARLLLELVASMTPTRRRVLLLRDAWGLAPAEVCEVLGVSRHAYRAEHARARKAVATKAAQLRSAV